MKVWSVCTWNLKFIKVDNKLMFRLNDKLTHKYGQGLWIFLGSIEGVKLFGIVNGVGMPPVIDDATKRRVFLALQMGS